MIRRLSLVATLVPVLLLGGCTTPDLRPVPEDNTAAWQQRQQSLSSLQQWDMRARIAVRLGDDGGQANLHWNHEIRNNDMRLVGAWGRGLVRLSFNDTAAELTDDTGRKTTGSDAAELLYQATGWVIPVRNLRSWVTGLPVTDQAQTKIDRYGRLQQITESGWQIDYQEYQRFGQWELPRRLKLSQLRTVNGEQLVSVRLVVNQWQAGS